MKSGKQTKKLKSRKKADGSFPAVIGLPRKAGKKTADMHNENEKTTGAVSKRRNGKMRSASWQKQITEHRGRRRIKKRSKPHKTMKNTKKMRAAGHLLTGMQRNKQYYIR